MPKIAKSRKFLPLKYSFTVFTLLLRIETALRGKFPRGFWFWSVLVGSYSVLVGSWSVPAQFWSVPARFWSVPVIVSKRDLWIWRQKDGRDFAGKKRENQDINFVDWVFFVNIL